MKNILLRHLIRCAKTAFCSVNFAFPHCWKAIGAANQLRKKLQNLLGRQGYESEEKQIMMAK
jgi:hypothetical protein